MHFQMWFPGATGCVAALQSIGAVDLREGCRESMAKFIDGRMGLLLSWTGDIGYVPERQRWVPLRNAEGPQVGYWSESPCVPTDLARRSLFDGYQQRLADGNDWVIPRATALPASFRLVDGAWSKVRKPQFDEFWARSEVWYRRFMTCDLDAEVIFRTEGISEEQFHQELADFCCFALRQNYRLLPEIASELDLLDSNSALSIVWSVIDGMAIKEILQEMQEVADVQSAFGDEKKVEVSAITDLRNHELGGGD